MHKPDFYFNGCLASDLGIRLQGPMTFSAPKPRVTTYTVPGRNGDLTYTENAFENITGKASCFSLQRNVDLTLLGLGPWMFSEGGYKRLETTEEPEIYRMAYVSNPHNTEIRMRLLAPFEIEFSCMPQRFYKGGEQKIDLKSGDVLHNIGMTALPLLELTGTGAGTMSVGSVTVSISEIGGALTIDCATQNAYSGTLNKNGVLTLSNRVYPSLPPGDTPITWSGGITAVTCTPRWWTL